ncbi:MAG TPA: glycosyltransferase family 4 protein [Solirubrobacteraceae bacterium]|jgi:glycosyltransferase involved in cell wall biosynthesis
MSRTPLRVAMIHLSDFVLDSRVQRHARALAERGDEVHLICIGERQQLRVGTGSIQVHPVNARKAHGHAGTYVRSYSSFLARALAHVSALDVRHRFDIVEAHNMPDLVVAAALVPRLRGAPVVLDVHDTFPELFATKFSASRHGLAERLLRWEEWASAAFSSHVVVVTEQARGRLDSRGVGVNKTTVVMNSPDERVFGPPRPPVRWPLRGPLRILYHGGLAPRFGVETLIRAVGLLDEGTAGTPQMPQVELRVCGSGEERERLAALAHQLAPGRVDVAREPVPFAQIPGELERAHIGVVPTVHDSFTELLLPVKLLEYVHMGLPVIASRLPCIGDYFTEGQELRMFTAGDPQDLAAALRELSLDPSAARERAVRARGRLQSIAWEHQRERYLALVDELVRAPAPRRARPVPLSTPR